MSESIPAIKLCYLKDAGKYRRLNEGLLLKSLSESRAFIRDRQSRGIDIYIWSYQGQEGYFYLQNPMAQESWAIIFHESGLVSAPLIRKIAEAVFREFPALYRLDSYPAPDDNADAAFEICLGQFDEDPAIQGRTYFSPQFSERQLAFIAWRFGYIALTTNRSGDKISRIDFVRRDRTMDKFLRSYALFYELIDQEGHISEGMHDPALLDPPAGLQAHNSVLSEAAGQIIAYLEGELQEFSFPWEIEEGTAFQKGVWEITRSIPYAHLFSYKDIAGKMVGDEKKAIQLSRAVGQALGANPLPFCIPCHRVIGMNRDLTGFTGGVDIKDFLLNLEFLNFN
ncbi:MAG: methylated-DNA--[protein]-cysteine S-methyltransferase [Clostridiaceae bacterium]|nr:methylated-DNA--[protein]-cysteine S-methyltransferase [Clostridiaceae bacterium]